MTTILTGRIILLLVFWFAKIARWKFGEIIHLWTDMIRWEFQAELQKYRIAISYSIKYSKFRDFEKYKISIFSRNFHVDNFLIFFRFYLQLLQNFQEICNFFLLFVYGIFVRKFVDKKVAH